MDERGEKLSPNYFIVDHSALILGLSDHPILGKKLEEGKVFVPPQVLRKLKKMREQGLGEGRIGLKELSKLRKKNIEITCDFDRVDTRLDPDEASLKLAKERGGTLLTGDRNLKEIGESIGIKTKLIAPKKHSRAQLRDFFDSETLSVHIKEGMKPMGKKGTPGNWEYVPIKDRITPREEVERMIGNILEEARASEESFIEIERPSSTIVQLEDIRTVITKPNFSEALEITAVKPVKKFQLSDYNLPESLIQRLRREAEGILIAGRPGAGKTTFAQALAEFWEQGNNVIKTIEAPRDMQLPKSITRFSKRQGTREELHDILLLSRPDFTIFDEMRNPPDFELYRDLRLAGVGMVGVIHSSTSLETIQRFVGTLPFGEIPSVVDTVLFMEKGEVERVLSLEMQVKVPHGLTERDLSRPVIVVSEFFTSQPVAELYAFGRRVFVVPVGKERRNQKSRGKKASKRPLNPSMDVRGNTLVFDFGKGEAGNTVEAHMNGEQVFSGKVGKSGRVFLSFKDKGRFRQFLRGYKSGRLEFHASI